MSLQHLRGVAGQDRDTVSGPDPSRLKSRRQLAGPPPELGVGKSPRAVNDSGVLRDNLRSPPQKTNRGQGLEIRCAFLQSRFKDRHLRTLLIAPRNPDEA